MSYTSMLTQSEVGRTLELPSLATALAAVRRGWWIFPTDPYSKRPYVEDGVRIAWSEVATNDVAEIRRRGWPEGANVAIACKPSGLLIADTDDHGGDNGIRAYTELCREHEPDGDWPDTYIAQTPTDSFHHYYVNPDPERYGNSTGGLPLGIDIRGGGGYVLAAGSVVDRRAYEGKPEMQALVGDGKPYQVYNDTVVIEPPGWLIGLLEATTRPLNGTGTPDTAGIWLIAKFSDAELEHYLERTISRVLVEPEGKRNSLLYWAAKRFGRAVALGRFDFQVAWDELKNAGDQAGLDEDEINPSIKSGFKKAGAL